MTMNHDQLEVECAGLDSMRWGSYKCWVLMEYINSRGELELGWDFRCFNSDCKICYQEIPNLNIVGIIGMAESLDYVSIKK